MNQINVGDRVIRIATDYTNGRVGEVVELKNDPPGVLVRVRVRWTHESSGREITKCGRVQPVRTWVQPGCLHKPVQN